SLHTGGNTDDESVGLLCSLTIGGNVARMVVKDWVEMPLTRVNRRLAEWFAHHEITSLHGGRTWHSLTSLARVTGRWQRDQGRYTNFGAKAEHRPAGIHHALYQCALHGKPLPPAVLAHLINRIRNDGRLDDARAALLRLALTRPAPRRKQAPMPLDPTNTHPAYVAGRAFAVLESIQYTAFSELASDGTRKRLNASFADRYFAGAIANPRAALVSGRRDAGAWLRRLRRDKHGAAVNLEKELNEVFDNFEGDDRNIPASTSLNDQALFLVGYHHQRAHQFANQRAATEAKEIPA
ncbi:MAG: type I-C CRISPR-associated protein Cas8c/Csd1, partial [Stackebrandtia sp.]